MPDVVRIRNEGELWRDGYANVAYALRTGDTMIVPYDACLLWFGDPRLVDTPSTAKFDRTDEINRMYGRLGCYDGDGASMAEKFEVRRPRVKVETLEGERVGTLIEQLDGTYTAPLDTGTPVDEKQAVAEELERMKAMQAQLLSRLSQLEAGDQTFDELPTDTPNKVPIDDTIP